VSWVTFPTLTDGQILTGAHMQMIRDNFAETGPAKATTAGSIFVGTGANALAERIPAITILTAAQAFTPTANVFADITGGTVGPTVGPLTTGTSALVMYGAELSNSTGGAANGCMSYAVSGATTQAATTTNMVKNVSSIAGDSNRAFAIDKPILTAGSNTFTAKYTSTTGGAVLAANRTMVVIPL
jgi:hypothetical protein